MYVLPSCHYFLNWKLPTRMDISLWMFPSTNSQFLTAWNFWERPEIAKYLWGDDRTQHSLIRSQCGLHQSINQMRIRFLSVTISNFKFPRKVLLLIPLFVFNQKNLWTGKWVRSNCPLEKKGGGRVNSSVFDTVNQSINQSTNQWTQRC